MAREDLSTPLLQQKPPDAEIRPTIYPACSLKDPTFSYINPILTRAKDLGFLENADICYLDDTFKSPDLNDNFTQLFESTNSIVLALIKTLGWQGIVMMVMVFCSTLLQFSDPLILKFMIQALSNNSEGNCIYYLIALSLICLLLRTFCQEHAINTTYLCNAKAFNCVFGLLYNKALRISHAAKSLLGTGKIMNILNGDGKDVGKYIHDFNVLWTIPIDVSLTILLLFLEVGWYAIMGALLICLGLAIQRWVYKTYKRLRRQMYRFMDNRTKYLNEYLGNIKIIKFNAWEDYAFNNIREAKTNEARLQFWADMLDVVNDVLIPFLIIMTISVIFTMEGGPLNAEKTFTIVALFMKLKTPLSSIAKSFTLFAKFRLGLARITLFMKTPEHHQLMLEDSSKQPDGEVHVNNATFAWVNSQILDHATEINNLFKKKNKKGPEEHPFAISTGPCLTNVSIHIKKGELVAIMGASGSGKSAFLESLLGELICLEGSRGIGGRVRYVSQTAWIINSTISENIRISRLDPPDEEWYQHCFKNCQLDVDAKQFLEGDNEELEARGFNLSGGQRARIGIAREIYADGDVFLFDDCFSALDSQVSTSIFQKIILDDLKGKTRVFLTHSFSMASQASQILILKEGKVVEQGTYSELLAKNGEFVRLHSGSKVAENLLHPIPPTEYLVIEDQKKEMRSRLSSTNKDNEIIPQKETKAVGSISWTVYCDLVKMGGAFLFIMAFFVLFVVEVMTLIVQWWLAIWISDYFSSSFDFYARMYALFAIIYFFILILRKFALNYFQYYLSIKSQLKLVNVLLHTKMSWFDITPIGRIVNRAVNDQSIVDKLGQSVTAAIQRGLSLLASIIAIGIITPKFFVLFAVLFGFYIHFYYSTIIASRDARRLMSMNLSPIFVLFNEILDGMINIRLANLGELFINRQYLYLNTFARSFMFKNYCSRWINLRISILGALAVTGACFFLAYDRDERLGSMAGFSLINAIYIIKKLAQLLLSISDVETEMSSMERICEYIECCPPEKSYDLDPPPSPDWPKEGKIEVSNLSIKYQPNMRSALKKINFVINPGEKIGVIGRTGSGKSTLALALLRMADPILDVPNSQEKHIFIDGVDVELLGLRYLREAISMIPQEPILFSGTIRRNLDPFDRYHDDNLIRVLEKVNIYHILTKKWAESRKEVDNKEGYVQIPMEEEILSDKDILGVEVRERGDNFSLGEKQLICIARALLKNPKILIMDEATASIDEATDYFIQEIIRKDLKNTTVIIIAHRLKTIMECNKIIVLQDGRLIDFDSPENLINKKSGFFYESLQQSAEKIEEVKK